MNKAMNWAGYGDHWSDLIGASHTKGYTIWEYGGMSALGVKRVAELGSISKASYQSTIAKYYIRSLCLKSLFTQ